MKHQFTISQSLLIPNPDITWKSFGEVRGSQPTSSICIYFWDYFHSPIYSDARLGYNF